MLTLHAVIDLSRTVNRLTFYLSIKDANNMSDRGFVFENFVTIPVSIRNVYLITSSYDERNVSLMLTSAKIFCIMKKSGRALCQIAGLMYLYIWKTSQSCWDLVRSNCTYL